MQESEFNQKMQQFISLVKKHEQISDQEIQDSWNKVEEVLSTTSIRRKKTFTGYIYAGIAAAASVIILLVFSFYDQLESEKSDLYAQNNQTVSIDQVNEIQLILADNQQVVLEDNAIVNYDEKGNVKVNNSSSEVVGQSEKQTENQMNQIIVPKGKRTHVILSDGTKMYINAASHVVYPSVFTGNKREIKVEGEVFLEVTPNPNAPFIVKANGLDVKVLGTTFNVTAYEKDHVSVVLVNGKVEVNSSTHEKILLNPSQMVSLKEGRMKKEEVDVFKYICWKDNLMLIEHETVSSVLDRLSRYYGVSILCDENVTNRKLSGKLNLSDSIDEVLEVVRISASLNMDKIKESNYRFYE